MENYDLFRQLLLDAVNNERTLLLYPWFFDPVDLVAFISRFFVHKYPTKKCVFLAPNKDLRLIKSKLIKHIEYPISIVDKHLVPSERVEHVSMASIVILSPNIFYNELLRGSISPEDLALIVVFEPSFPASKKPLRELFKIVFQTENNSKLFVLDSDINTSEELIELCKLFKITRLESLFSDDYGMPHKALLRIVPLSEQLFSFVFELSKTLEEYKQLFQQYDVVDLLFIRKHLEDFISHIKSSMPVEFQDVVIQKGIEFIHLQRIKELAESVGSQSCLAYLNKLRSNSSSSPYLQTFVSSPLYTDLLNSLSELQNHLHAKLLVLIDILRKSRESNKRIEIIVPERSIAKHVYSVLTEKGFKGNLIIGKRSKARTQIISAFENGFSDFLISSAPVSTAERTIFYALPKQFRTFVVKSKLTGKSIFLITHRSFEEHLYYSFLAREREKSKLLDNPDLKALLLKNQSEDFAKKQDSRLNPRLKALINIKKVFDKEQRSLETKHPNDELIKAVAFLTNLSEDQAARIVQLLKLQSFNDIKSIKLQDLVNIFSDKEAKHVFIVLQQRLALIV